MTEYDANMMEVEGLMTFGADINDPATKPWFHISIHIDYVIGWDVVTKDGISFRYFDDKGVGGVGYFSPEDRSTVKKIIKRYIKNRSGVNCSA